MLITYIIKTANKDFYCGVTNHLIPTLKGFQNSVYPCWFAQVEGRQTFDNIIYFNGDIRDKIKAFGIKRFYGCIKNAQRVPRFIYL